MLQFINAKSNYTPYKYYKNIELLRTDDPIKNCSNFFNEIFNTINNSQVSDKTKKKHIKEVIQKQVKEPYSFIYLINIKLIIMNFGLIKY